MNNITQLRVKLQREPKVWNMLQMIVNINRLAIVCWHRLYNTPYLKPLFFYGLKVMVENATAHRV